MKIDSIRSGLAALVAFVGLGAAMVAIPVPASAGVVSKSLSTCDQFSSFSYDSTSGTLSITCTTTAPAACSTATAGTFTIAGAGGTHGTATINGQATFTITRNNGCLGSYIVIFGFDPTGPSGYSIASGATPGTSNYVTFADGDANSKIVTINVGGTTGSLGVFLTNSYSTPGYATKIVNDPTRYVIDVGTTPVTAPPNNPPNGCATTATVTEVMDKSGFQYAINLKPGETKAFQFTMPSTAVNYVAAVNISTFATNTEGSTNAAGHQIVISPCPGDFTSPSACNFTTPNAQLGVNMSMLTIDPLTASPPAYGACGPVRAGTLYANVRFTDSAGTNLCNNATGCVQWAKIILP